MMSYPPSSFKLEKSKFDINDEAVMVNFDGVLFNRGTLDIEKLKTLDEKTLPDYIRSLAFDEINKKKALFPTEVFSEFLKVVALRVIDTHWTKHIDQMSELRQAVTLQSYGQGNPLQIYQNEGFRKFSEMTSNIAKDIATFVLRAQIRQNTERQEVVKKYIHK